jgi:hypothetical protein
MTGHMSLDIGPIPSGAITPPQRVAAAPRAVAHPATAALEAAFDVDYSELIPTSPPPRVRAEVQLAAQRAAQMAADDRELHFRVDDETGRVVVQVRDLDGHVLRTIPPSGALHAMAGDLEV